MQRILIVDDVPLNIQVLNEALQDEYRIFFATSGREALDNIESVNPDIVLLDIMMPDIDGYEVCRQLKESPLSKDIPIIFITALEEVEHETAGLQLGAVDYITKPFNPDIVRLRIRNHLELKKSRDILVNLSRIDGLTGVANRRAFDEHLNREWLRSKREGKPISILMIDVDFFKRYNDFLGHAAGDECLKRVASTISASLHRPSDFLARYGGEEFVCLLPDTDEAGALFAGQNIMSAVEALHIHHPNSDVSNHITVSIGTSTSSGYGDEISEGTELTAMADNALYKAKSSGRNRVVSHSNQPIEQIQDLTVCTSPSSDANLKELLVSFAEQNPNPVMCVRFDGTIIYGNSASSNIFCKWCCPVGGAIPKQLKKAINERGARGIIEFFFEDRLYSFFIVPVTGRDAIFLYGTDITEIRASEEELKRLMKVIEESINIVFITDIKGDIEYVNSTFEKITGYSRGYVIGKNPRILASGETSKANYKNLWDTILAGKTWRGIFKNKKSNGEIYWANGFISPIKNDQGQITHFMAIQEDISEKMLAEARLHYLASYDSVTSVINRSRFVELLSESLSPENEPSSLGVLLQINIDAFKLVNDTYGYSIGDQFLKNFAEFLKKHTEELDTVHRPNRQTIVGRLGGDEFAVFLFDRDEREGMQIAEDIRRRIENYRFLNDMIRATASIGVSIYPEQGLTTSELLTKASAATNRAKELGQNRCYLYRDGDTYLRTAPSSLEEKQRIISAMEEDRFVPYFQPILNIPRNEIMHYEALARLVAPDGAIILPSAFIFTAERYGLVSGIDRIITQKTMLIQAELSRLGKRVSFSMNLSGKHLGDESMLEYLKTHLKDTGADPECIIFELTETSAIFDFQRAVEFVRELKQTGCKFSLDDFGVGFTSFVHIIEMEVDYIKIDGSFIRNLPERQRDRMLVKTISEMARGLGIKTIAEYVDREETLHILRDMNIDYAQGYFIGKPSPHLIS